MHQARCTRAAITCTVTSGLILLLVYCHSSWSFWGVIKFRVVSPHPNRLLSSTREFHMLGQLKESQYSTFYTSMTKDCLWIGTGNLKLTFCLPCPCPVCIKVTHPVLGSSSQSTIPKLEGPFWYHNTCFAFVQLLCFGLLENLARVPKVYKQCLAWWTLLDAIGSQKRLIMLLAYCFLFLSSFHEVAFSWSVLFVRMSCVHMHVFPSRFAFSSDFGKLTPQKSSLASPGPWWQI